MNILSALKFIALSKLNEKVTLSDIRRGMLGKGHEYKIADKSKFWYNRNKEELLDLLNDIATSDNKIVKQKMQKFDTDPYFEKEDDYKRSLKPEQLMKALEYEFSSATVSADHIKNKSSKLSDQYEKLVLDNGVEIYAVYTPLANIQLSHSILQKHGDPIPSWCIASPSDAATMWSNYDLYDAEGPVVFIVYKKGEPKKYELKADPRKCLDFKNKKIRLGFFIDEWRDPLQTEETLSSTSLFDVMGISLNTLENAIRHLMNTKKAESYSMKYGKEMYETAKEVPYLTGKERILELTNLARNGMLLRFFGDIRPDEQTYFFKELIKYNTLTDEYLDFFNTSDKPKIIDYLIKEKKVGMNSIIYLDKYDFNKLKKIIPQINPILYSFILSNTKHKEIIEAVYKVAISNKSIDGDFLYYLQYKDEAFFIKNTNEIIDTLISSKTMTAKAARLILTYNDELDLKTVKNICMAITDSRGSNLEEVFYKLKDAKYEKIFPDIISNYIKTKDIDPEIVYSFPSPWNQKGLEKLLLEKKFYWFMLYGVENISEELKNTIFEHLIKQTKLGYIRLTSTDMAHLFATNYAIKAANLYIKQNSVISIENLLEMLPYVDKNSSNIFIKIANMADYKGYFLQYEDIDELIDYSADYPREIYIIIKNLLDKADPKLAKNIAQLLSVNHDLEPNLYTLVTEYLNKEEDPETKFNKLLAFIDSNATKIINSLMRSFKQDSLKLFIEIYSKINAIYDPDGEEILAPESFLNFVFKNSVLSREWDEIIDNIYNRGISIDKELFKNRCEGIIMKICNSIKTIYDKIIQKTNDKFLHDITYYDHPSFNPYIECCKIVLQKLENKF